MAIIAKIFTATLLVILSATARAATLLPVEVMGKSGTIAQRTVTLPPGRIAARLWLRANNLSYADKASVRIVGGAWIPLNNTTANIEGPARGYGGIGGPVGTLSLSVPVEQASGAVTVQFRFNSTDGVSSGFRVVAFNVLDIGGNPLLPASAFVQDDPATWRAPLPLSTDIAAGRKVWQAANLRESPLALRSLTIHCADCHARDGRDLKYFAYSNLSIIERCKFHGLTDLQGRQVASYIRSLPGPAYGRPWNPPYQPGPGLDAKPLAAWAAGAGSDAALANDADSLARSTQGTPVNLRETPVALMLPDWNHWLPRVHPKDAWGDAFVNDKFNKCYNGEGGASLSVNLHTYYASWKAGTITTAQFTSLFNGWDGYRRTFIAARSEPASIVWTPAYSEQVFSTAKWQAVKLWEMMQEFGIEGLAQGPEARAWFASTMFEVSPHKMHIPSDSRGVGGSALYNKYLSNAWYHLQMVLNPGNGRSEDHTPIDWPYLYGNLKDLQLLSGQGEPGRLVASLVKSFQERSTTGPENNAIGWSPEQKNNLTVLVATAFAPMWNRTDPAVKRAALEAVTRAWFDRCRAYPPSAYYAGGHASPTEIPPTNVQDRSFSGQMWYQIPQLRAAGVDGVLLDSMCDWAATVWPLGDWGRLKAAPP